MSTPERSGSSREDGIAFTAGEYPLLYVRYYIPRKQYLFPGNFEIGFSHENGGSVLNIHRIVAQIPIRFGPTKQALVHIPSQDTKNLGEQFCALKLLVPEGFLLQVHVHDSLRILSPSQIPIIPCPLTLRINRNIQMLTPELLGMDQE